MNSNNRIAHLPKWVRDYILSLKREIERRDDLVKAHALLMDKENTSWYSLNFDQLEMNEFRELWIIENNRPRPIFSVSKDTTILICKNKS